ncbi:MAG: hypothetical protein NT113_14560 [Hyphomicrobiales bacterium]|nr:hypothetical protein [Hyphomicrobiales bacterium]
MKHPVSRQMRLFLDPADVDRFDAEYISLFNLSRLTKRGSKALKIDLAKRSIHPSSRKPTRPRSNDGRISSETSRNGKWRPV